MLHVYTGNGKGKTTCALGLISRSLGRDNRVCLIQFMKKDASYGEIVFFKKQANIDIFQFGTDSLVDPNNPAKVDFSEAEIAYQHAKDAINGKAYNLIVIDEINVAVKWGLLSLEKQLELAQQARHMEQEVVMTGRYASAEIIKQADLVTEMTEIKHYWEAGVPARPGIEF